MKPIRALAFCAPLLLAACSPAADDTAEKAAPVAETPQTPEAYIEKSAQLRRDGKHKEALDTALRAFILAREGPRVAERIELAKANGAAGGTKTMGAINEIKSLEVEKRSGTPVDEVAIAEVYAQIGDTLAVFRWLTRAVEAKSPKLAGIADNKDLEPMKGDPRWQMFLSTLPK